MTAAPSLTVEEVGRFLAGVHADAVTGLTPLSGGFWSSAYAYDCGGDELVVRFGSIRSGFDADRAAMAYATDDLPVPEVLDVGDAFGAAYAISRRHHGRFLEDLEPDEADAARPMVRRLLTALRTAPALEGVTDEPASWQGWLLASLEDDPDHPTGGWRAKLAADPSADERFEEGAARIRELVPRCPERRDLVHGDLLHRNVLVADDASRVTAVFSWKCSMRGDFLYDTAWCTFWGDTFHPGIGALDVFALVAGDPSLDDEARADAAVRHHCYELHVGTAHLGWYAWTGDTASSRRIEDHLAMLLERGPRSMP